ncbi:MAG: Do family serine endopeptidase [Chitinophagales bacterium]
MKRTFQLVLAAILGSVITLTAFQMTGLNQKTVIFQDANGTVSPAALTNYDATANNNHATSSVDSKFGPADFTYAAEKTTPAVVHIKSTEKARTVRGGDPQGANPFKDFFGDGFDEFFFNPNGRGGQPQPRVGTGSGVIIDADGYIVTNNHVIEGADEIEVTLHDNRKFIATLVGTDPSTDIALLKVEGTNLPILELANSDEAKIGEWVLAVGNPFNLSSTVTAGIVSAKGRSINILREKSKTPIESFIQTDAAVNPGNSGGALVNAEGKLLGINTAIATPTGTYAGYSFAVPVNIVHKVVDDLREHGVVQRGFLGIIIRDLDGTLAKELGLNLTQGVYVDSLATDGSAIVAGIEKGDVVVKIDGGPVNSVPELQEMVGRHRPGDVVNITVSRNGREKTIPVTLKNREGNTKVVTKESAAVLEKLGVELGELKPDELTKLNIPSGVRVESLEDGKLRTFTDIRKGFVITEVNQREVGSVSQFKKIMENMREGELVTIGGVYSGGKSVYYYTFQM